MYKESIRSIMEANRDDVEMLDFVESRVNSFVDYVGHVSFMETRMQRLQIQGVRGEEWRDAAARLDERRRDKHETAMSAVNQLNRLCTASGLPLFYTGPVDHEHRNEIGDLCQAVVNEYFEGRHTHPLSITEMMSDGKAFASAVENISEQKDGLTH